MAIRADSYSSAAEVVAFTPQVLDGQSSFNSTTQPTLTQVEKFIDRASGYLNAAIAGAGLSPAGIIANSTAKLTCDDWVTARASEYVELTKRGVGYSEAEGQRIFGFANLYKKAADFVGEMALGWKRLGVTVAHPLAEGLQSTGQDNQTQRADYTDATLEQPIFTRELFDNKREVYYGYEDTGDDQP